MTKFEVNEDMIITIWADFYRILSVFFRQGWKKYFPPYNQSASFYFQKSCKISRYSVRDRTNAENIFNF